MLSLRRTGPFPWGPTVFFLAWVWAPGLSRAAVTCVGDCHREGAVTLGDLVTLVNIALNPTQLTACEAGDANGDQSIAVDEIVTAATNALYGCAAIHVGSANGAPGAHPQITVTLNPASWAVFGTDNKIAFTLFP